MAQITDKNMDQEMVQEIDKEMDQKMDQEMAASTSADEEDVRIIGQMSAELHRSGIDIGIYDIIELDVESFEELVLGLAEWQQEICRDLREDGRDQLPEIRRQEEDHDRKLLEARCEEARQLNASLMSTNVEKRYELESLENSVSEILSKIQ